MMANEKRLIDATEARKHSTHDIITHFLDRCPTVDTVEVVHGHWYKAPHHPYRCSCCGEMALLDMYGESHVRSNYCPNCGAKMDGDGNG